MARLKIRFDQSILYVFLLYIYAFKNLMRKVLPAFSYYDELLALVGLTVFAYKIIRSQNKQIKRQDFLLAGGLLLFVFSGLLGNIANHYQPSTGTILLDLYLCLKFWFWMYLGYYLCPKISLDVIKRIDFHAKLLTAIFTGLVLIDIVFHVFNEYTDIKNGVRSVGLFEGPAGLASVAVTFLCAHIMAVKKRKLDIWMITNLFILCMTLRFKSLAAAAVFLLLLFYEKFFKEKVKLWYLGIMGCTAVIVARYQIIMYLVKSVQNARTQLFIVAFKILKDYFPIGTGFGTYASYYSGISYSKVYSIYRLDHKQGLSADKPAFISDTFWPMPLGQTGVIGSIGFAMMLIWLYKKIQKCAKYSIMLYTGALFIFLYLLLTSFGESSFLHWNAHMLAILLGVVVRFVSDRNGKENFEMIR